MQWVPEIGDKSGRKAIHQCISHLDANMFLRKCSTFSHFRMIVITAVKGGTEI